MHLLVDKWVINTWVCILCSWVYCWSKLASSGSESQLQSQTFRRNNLPESHHILHLSGAIHWKKDNLEIILRLLRLKSYYSLLLLMNRTAAMICLSDCHCHVFMRCNFNGGEINVSTWTTLQRGEGKGREIKLEALVCAEFSDRLEFIYTDTHQQRLPLLASLWVMCCKVMWMGWLNASLVVHTIQHPPLLWKCIGSDSGTNQQGRGSQMLHSRTS